MRQLIQSAFGSLDLYKILRVPSSATTKALRKAYHKRALEFHPDKNPNSSLQFQAVSSIYEYLSNEENRKEYNDSGELPEEDDLDHNNNAEDENIWKSYFENLFGRVTVKGIESFAEEYQNSPEEEQDVLKEFRKHKGNLAKVLEYVMLSEPHDAPRWVESYLNPALANGTLDAALRKPMEVSLKKLQSQIKTTSNQQPPVDDDETESEEEPTATQPKASKKRKQRKDDDMSSLIAQIQNKRRGKTNLMANLSSRYGVAADDDDPLDDATFASIQSRLGKKP